MPWMITLFWRNSMEKHTNEDGVNIKFLFICLLSSEKAYKF